MIRYQRRALLILALAATVGSLAFAAQVAPGRFSTAHAIGALAAGWSFVLAGLFALDRRPGNRIAWLMIAVGFIWFGPDIGDINSSLTYTVGQLLQGSQWVLLATLGTLYPSGHAQTRLESLTLIYIGLFALPNALGTLPYDPYRPPGCGSGCPADLVSIHPDAGIADSVQLAIAVAGAAMAVLVLTGFLLRWRRASPSGKRAFTPVAAGMLVCVAAGLMNSVSVSHGSLIPDWVRQVAFLSLSGGLLIGLLRAWLDRSAVSKLVVDLGAVATPGRLRVLLAGALHDPTLELLYWEEDQHAYVGVDGSRWPSLPAASAGRAVTALGAHVAALIHDPSLLDEPELIESVAQAARMALENERLQAEVRAQLDELRASRQRIAEAALTERRRVERDLHDGAQQRLVTLSLSVAMARERAATTTDPQLKQMLTEVSEQLACAVDELRQLARGIHPALLTEAGLGPALASLAERASLPVRIASAPAGRFSASVEATSYFVVSEALTNVAKHARASQATVHADERDGTIVVEIVDDGVGGARIDGGSGLSGLADRVAAIAGRLEIDSPTGRGTRITAQIPCE